VIAFVRHGETAANQAGLLLGRADPSLTEVGRRQAQQLADALAAEPVARVVASPLRRAGETAALIARVHDLGVEVDDRLIEIDYGEWDGRPFAAVDPGEWVRWRGDAEFAPPGGERLLDVDARVAAFCEETFSAAGDAGLIAVSHVSPVKAAVAWALGLDNKMAPHAAWRMHLGLASITRIGVRGTTPFLLTFNEQGHLWP
jgi:probable phosphoglycerate mutase